MAEPRFHSSKHLERDETQEMSDRDLAVAGLRKHNEFHQEAEREVKKAFAPLNNLNIEERAKPKNIAKYQETVQKVTERLRTHKQAYKVLSNGLTDRAMRDTSTLLSEFYEHIEKYRKKIAQYEETIPKAIAALEERKKSGNIRGTDLVKINTQIAQLHEVIPNFKKELQVAENARQEQLESFSNSAMDTAIFRIKLARILTELREALEEKTVKAVTVLVCTSEILFSRHDEPYTLDINQREGTCELKESEPEEDFSFWQQTRRIREAQNHLRVKERMAGPGVVLDANDFVE